MQDYATVLTYAIPLFLLLVLIEYLISIYRGMVIANSFDTVSSLSSGMTNIIKDVLGIAVVIVSYKWMSNHFAIVRIETSPWVYILAFIGLDFAGYWIHRFEHEINIFWNRHIIHHSSEEFNLACALRQNVSAIVGVFFFLFIPMALIGIPPEVVAIVAPIHLFAQFWYHTRLIDKMGLLEYILVTPSHHRVHHAINDQYLDRNYSQIFIIWDKLFGTYQEELAEVPAVYGVKRQVSTWNPILINFQHLFLILKDAWYTRSFSDKIKVFFAPTGWRPEDRLIEDPVPYIKDPYAQTKYKTYFDSYLNVWIWFQMALHLCFLLHMFSSFGSYDFNYILLYGLFIVAGIFGYTSLMDYSRWSIVGELVKIAVGLYLVSSLGGWFSIENLFPYGTVIFNIYMTLSFLVSIFTLKKYGRLSI